MNFSYPFHTMKIPYENFSMIWVWIFHTYELYKIHTEIILKIWYEFFIRFSYYENYIPKFQYDFSLILKYQNYTMKWKMLFMNVNKVTFLCTRSIQRRLNSCTCVFIAVIMTAGRKPSCGSDWFLVASASASTQSLPDPLLLSSLPLPIMEYRPPSLFFEQTREVSYTWVKLWQLYLIVSRFLVISKPIFSNHSENIRSAVTYQFCQASIT